jgi:hypothetical protein
MGPSWLKIKGAVLSPQPLSWAALDVVVASYKGISKADAALDVPPLKVASLRLLTALNQKSHQHEIVGFSLLTHPAMSADGPTPQFEERLVGFNVVRTGSKLFF